MNKMRRDIASARQTNISEVLINKGERRKYTYRHEPDGTGYYLVNGEKMTEHAFNQMLPIEIKPIRSKGAGLDGSKEWLFS